jgi:hypothetical protein
MEITCSRCHQTVEADNCYCPVCGLPQLVYTADGAPGAGQPEQWSEVVRDAGSIAWKPVLQAALRYAIPAGMLCSVLSSAGLLGLLLMAMTGAWVVVLYSRSQQPAWITIGAGARIGLVTGMLGGWAAAATTGIILFATRYGFHQGKFFDDFWLNFVNLQMSQQWTSMGIDAQTIALTKAWLLSPEGRAGWVLSIVVFMMALLLLFAVAGGALGARFLARKRRPEL